MSNAIKVVVIAAIASALLGVVSAALPLPAIVGALLGLFALMGWLLYLNIDGGKGMKVIVALISAGLNVVAFWYVWITMTYDLETANFVLTGGSVAFAQFWQSLTSTEVSVRGTDLGNYMTYTSYASTLAVAFPPLIWAVFAGNSKPAEE
ncbi:hypothetical protein RXV86_16190 [Alisedimentitalea sp. MJ-SS2]|uniref:hypothetical protein n=1 Tax=Aliisedimentitalea sp. MJ-SS2 TaxID=3049795 RepID=UPI002914F776|nr:hypothetical protein [Alisedimentitalea sp. MJ-SS2]MDU8928934.1 hypothetical protein [Alisedimentitalea sp. MJ-SS2]